MSTNYYCKYIPSNEDYDNLKKAVEEKNLELIKEFTHKFTFRYHIGKYTDGWAFAFQAPNRYYAEDDSAVPWQDNLESLKEFLNRQDVQIFNEWNEPITYIGFWNKIKDHIYVDEHHKGETKYNENNIVKDRVRWTYCWFQ